MDGSIGERLARVESDVKHIQADVSDIKIDLRRTNEKVDSLDNRLNEKIDDLNKSLNEKFDAAKTWAFGLYAGLGTSLLLIIAKGLKWL